jgi:hypothetical protein
MSKLDSGTLRFGLWDNGHYEEAPVYKASGTLNDGTYVEISVPCKLMLEGSGYYHVTIKARTKVE